MESYKDRADRIARERIDQLQMVEYEFELYLDTSQSIWTRLGAFMRGENHAGRTVGRIFDVLLLPFSGARTARALAQQVLKRKQRPMLQKILSVRNFVNMTDEDGNFAWDELGASILQLGIAIGIAYALTELGLWEQFMQLKGD